MSRAEMALPRRFSSISTMPAPGDDDRFTYKIITLGNAGVGKSTMLASYCRGTCQLDLSQQSFIDNKIVKQGQSIVQVSLWDTAGQERYDSITTNYYRGAHGCILCFDISNEQSYADLITWHEKLVSHCDPAPATILVGTKSDLRKSTQCSQTLISHTDCRLAARNLGVSYKEVSSYQQETLDEALDSLIDMISAKKNNRPVADDNNNNRVSLTQPEKQPIYKTVCKNLC